MSADPLGATELTETSDIAQLALATAREGDQLLDDEVHLRLAHNFDKHAETSKSMSLYLTANHRATYHLTA